MKKHQQNKKATDQIHPMASSSPHHPDAPTFQTHTSHPECPPNSLFHTPHLVIHTHSHIPKYTTNALTTHHPDIP